MIDDLAELKVEQETDNKKEEYCAEEFDKSEARRVDCSRIGLEKQVVDGPTGEPEDYVQVDTMDDVFPGGSVDLSLRVREATTRQERIPQRVLQQEDQWCADYEEKIRSMSDWLFH